MLTGETFELEHQAFADPAPPRRAMHDEPLDLGAVQRVGLRRELELDRADEPLVVQRSEQEPTSSVDVGEDRSPVLSRRFARQWWQKPDRCARVYGVLQQLDEVTDLPLCRLWGEKLDVHEHPRWNHRHY